MKKLCPCHSGKEYEMCCKPFHKGRSPENALLLMRSHYAAYALNLAEYIIQTTHPSSPLYLNNKTLWKQQISSFSKDSSFDNLTILEFTKEGNHAEIIFTACISQNGQDASFTEKSSFEKKNNRWLYFGGFHIN